MLRMKKEAKDATGKFVDRICESFKEPGWECEGPNCVLGMFIRIFRHEAGVVIEHWSTYCKEMLWFREPEIRITPEEEKRLNLAMIRWVNRQRREVSDALVRDFVNEPSEKHSKGDGISLTAHRRAGRRC